MGQGFGMISSSVLKRDSLLFVYGTLRPFVTIPMARWLTRVARHVGVARTPGRLYDLGPYPGLRAARRRGEWVVGDLYRLATPRATLQILDRYEAGVGRKRPRFVRAQCTVERGGGRRHVAWLYVYQPSVLSRMRIAHGDYGRHLAAFGGNVTAR
jgi:gamma-glutamylcyclotransferase (GGCT)/AIG2-like uncharacterized protein YtfP